MPKPILLVIAGCNGSGKSSFSRLLSPSSLIPFDYDYHFLRFYKALIESELRETMAHNMAFSELESQIQNAIINHQNFCYETNFNSTPLHWPQLFKENGYELRMIYLCLNSIEEATRRVAIRVNNGGHFVPDNEIRKRYFEGFANLNSHFKFFDCIDLFETSTYGATPKYIFSVESGLQTSSSSIPQYLIRLLPNMI